GRDLGGGYRRWNCSRRPRGSVGGIPAGGRVGEEGGGHGAGAHPVQEVRGAPRRADLGEESGGTGIDVHVHAAGPAVSDRALWHPWLRVQRLIRSFAHTRWTRV